MTAPVILLRNTDKRIGLCNGTRLIVKGLGINLIVAMVAVSDHKGEIVALPRIIFTLEPVETGLPFKVIRKQFPINLAFALTINKSQGKTIPIIGIDLQEPLFSHRQLYVALS